MVGTFLTWCLIAVMSGERGIITVVVGSSDHTRPAAVCPWGFTNLYNPGNVSMCYQVMEPATWATAQETCHGMGSNVLSIGSGSPLDDDWLMTLLCDAFDLEINVSSMWLSLYVIKDRLWWYGLAPSPVQRDDSNITLPTITRPQNEGEMCSVGGNRNPIWPFGQPSLTTGNCGRLQLELTTNQQEMLATAWLHDCNDELPYMCWNQGMEYSLDPDISGCPPNWKGSMNSIYCLNQPVSTSDFDNAQFACEFYQNANAQVAQPYKPEIYAMMEALSPDGPVWLGGEVTNGVVSWRDGHEDDLDSYPWVSRGQLDTGCLAWESTATGSAASIRQCSDKLGVVCVSPIDETEVAPPEAVLETTQIWTSVEEIRNPTDLNLKCVANNIHPTLPVIWRSNAYLLPNGSPAPGLQLSLTKDLAATVAWPYPGQYFEASLIGNYQCVVRGQIPRLVAISRQARVLLYDVARLSTVVVIPDRVCDPFWRDQRLFTGISSYDPIYKNIMRDLFSYFIGKRLVFPFEITITEYSNISMMSTDTSLVVSSILQYKNDRESQVQESPDPGALLDAWQAEVDSRVNDAVQTRLDGDDDLWNKKWGHLGITDVQISILDSIPGSEYCDERMTEGLDGTPLHWDMTYVGDVANSTELCMWDGLPLATCACMNGSNSTAYWGTIVHMNCTPSYTSDVTDRLEDMAKDDITVSNAVEVSQELTNLTSNATILAPADIVFTAQIVENLVSVPSVPVEVGDALLTTINQAMNVDKDTMARAQQADNSSNKMISSLDQFASTTNMSDSNSTVLVQPQVALGVYDVTETLATQGMAVLTDTKPGFRPSNIIPLNTDSTGGENKNLVDSAIMLPEELINELQLEKERQDALLQNTTDPNLRKDILSSPVRISFVAFEYDSLFLTSDALKNSAPLRKDTSSVISASIHSYRLSTLNKQASQKMATALPKPVRLAFRTEKANLNNTCVFWDFQAREGNGDWSPEGCYVVAYDDTHTSCACNHLTNFAVLMDVNKSPISSIHNKILSYISIIGLSLSIIGLTLTIITFIYFRTNFMSKRTLLSDTHVDKQILLHLCSALLAVYIVFLAGIEQTENTAGCKVVSGLLHYLLMASFCWMLVEAVRQFLRYYNRSHCLPEKFVLKGSIVSWGIPLIIVISIASANSNLMISDDFCWVRDEALYFGFLLPLGIIIVTNTVLYSLAIYRITCGRMASSNAKTSLITHLRVSVLLFVLLGVTWVFGFLAIADARLVFQYLFCIFNSIQGFMIFWLHCFRDPRVRKRWMELCSCVKFPACCSTGRLVPESDTIETVESTTRSSVKSTELTDLQT